MKILPNSVYLKRIFGCCTKKSKIIENSSSCEINRTSFDGSNALSEQNRIMLIKQVSNYIEPLQSEFKSTKEMLRYAKSRCLEGIKQGYEHTVFMDTKENRVLCELKGDTDNCSVDVIKYLNTDKANIAVMHGHPEDYPLSYMDVKFLYDYAVGQVIAINERGEFSLMANKYEQPLKNSESRLNRWRIRRKAMRRAKAFNDYSVTSAYDYQDFKQNTLPHLYKNLVNSTLREYAPKMDMRYVSNYTYS